MKAFLLVLMMSFAVGLQATTNSVVEKTIPWRAPLYSLTAQGMPLRQALETFGTAQGISVVMSGAVGGAFSGAFKDVPAGEFLERVATTHNLIWYYDGAALYLYGSGEIQTFLLDLKYMKAEEVRSLIRELGVEDARYPIKTASNDELIMVSGPPRYVALVAETIAKADKLRELRTFNEVEVRIFPLEHTWADDVQFNSAGAESSVTIRGVANILAEMMEMTSPKVRESTGAATNSKDASTETATASSAAAETIPEATIGFQPVIRPDNRLNAVIVRDVVTRFPMYEKLIRELDVPQKLVEVSVTVVEMSRDDALDWQLSFQAEATKDDISGAIGHNVDNLLESALTGRGLAGAMTYLGDDFSVSASLLALREDGRARSISRTSILTLNNLAAELSDIQSYHARVVGSEVAALEEVSAGTRLQIKPRIIRAKDESSPSRVWLTMELQDGGFEAVSVDAMPMTRTSTLETQASVLENHSIMLAGYLRDVKGTAKWGVPYLRDIPVIGWLFGGLSETDETVQRLFILTPYIVDADAPDVARAQASRQRDVVLEELLESDKHADDLERKERNAQLEEQYSIREEYYEDLHDRNSQERDLRREQRQDLREVIQEDWDAYFETRKQIYKEAKEEAKEKREALLEEANEADEATDANATDAEVTAVEDTPVEDALEVESSDANESL